MIQIGETTINLNDPLTLAAVISGIVMLLVVILLIVAVRRADVSKTGEQLASIHEELARKLTTAKELSDSKKAELHEISQSHQKHDKEKKQ